jgi:hypothetical protein
LDEVEVVRVSHRCGQDELVERRSTTERQRPGQRRLGEDLDEHSREDQIVFDLMIAGPLDHAAPVSDERGGDHTSGSIRALTMSRHR